MAKPGKTYVVTRRRRRSFHVVTSPRITVHDEEILSRLKLEPTLTASAIAVAIGASKLDVLEAIEAMRRDGRMPMPNSRAPLRGPSTKPQDVTGEMPKPTISPADARRTLREHGHQVRVEKFGNAEITILDNTRPINTAELYRMAYEIRQKKKASKPSRLTEQD